MFEATQFVVLFCNLQMYLIYRCKISFAFGEVHKYYIYLLQHLLTS